MSKNGKLYSAGLKFAGGAVLTAAFMLVTKYTGWDKEIVCRPTARGSGELQIVKRHKYLPFSEDVVYAGVPFQGLIPREGSDKALEGVGYVNHTIFHGAGPLAAFRYIPRSHCRVTYFRRLDGQVVDTAITAPYRSF